jgi:hypothetical protein
MRLIAALGMVLAALWGLMVGVPALQALPTTQSQFYYVYGTKKDSHIFRSTCMLCHEKRSGRRLNKYGEDLRRAGKYGRYEFKGYRAIEKLDSDKDGFTNGEEIGADKLPGSRLSKPKRQKKQSPSAETGPKNGTDKKQDDKEDQDEEKKDET